MARYRIGIDLGGTKIEGVLLNEEGGEAARRRVTTPQGDYRATLAQVAALARALEQEGDGPATIGIGIPGALSLATGRVKNANSVCLIGRPLVEDLQALLDRPVRAANDANCFALSEATDGAAAGMPIMFGVIVGTGTGGGLVAHGRIITGVNAIAGEWGHNPLPWMNDYERPGPLCYCGKHGCIETYLSGPGLSRDHELHTSVRLSAAQIAQRGAAGDLQCFASLDRYMDRMARALATVINVIDPHVIVLGGGLSNIAELYREVPARWGRYVFSDTVQTRLCAPKFGDSSGVRGAAWLWD